MSKYIDGINETNMDAFLADLRSGDFVQGKNALERKNGSFCCLGVACQRAAKEGVVKRSTMWGSVYYAETSGALPKAVADWLGLPETHRVDGVTSFDIPFFKQGFLPGPASKNRVHTAIGWNDGEDKTFSEIADALEKEFTRE